MNNKKIQVETRTMIIFWLIPLAIALVALFIWQALTGLVILGLALFLALAISPLVKGISRRIPGRSRNLVTALAYIVVVGILSLILIVVVPVVIGETSRLVSGLPEAMRSDSDLWNGLNSFGHNIGIDDLRAQVVTMVENFAESFDLGGAILSGVGTIGSILAGAVLVLILAFLMLIEGPQLLRFLRVKFQSDQRAQKAITTAEKMGSVVSKYVSGQLTVALIDGGFTALTVFVLSFIFGFSPSLAIPFGLITGTLCLIPLFGSFIGGSIVSLLLILSSPWAALIYFIIFIIYLQMEGNVIVPKVQSKGLRLPALAVLGSITIGIYMFGILGAIIAIPIAGCIKVIIDEY